MVGVVQIMCIDAVTYLSSAGLMKVMGIEINLKIADISCSDPILPNNVQQMELWYDLVPKPSKYTFSKGDNCCPTMPMQKKSITNHDELLT